MLLDGKKLALEIQSEIQKKVATLRERKPGLAFILVGDDPASRAYVRAKNKACHSVGMISKTIELPVSVAESDLIKQIDELNRDPEIDGILVQLPLPYQISTQKVTLAIDPKKDVDGFHPINVGKMLLGDSDGFLPCTPHGIKVLLERYQIEVEGKHVVILGRSNIVGKPLAAILMQKKIGCNATVTVAHSQSEKLSDLTRSADILVAALGKPRFITKEFVKRHAAVIDVGINRMPDGKLVGDVDFEAVKEIADHITPVPGGIGPMTIAMLLQNTLLSFLKIAVVLLFLASCQKQETCTEFEGEARNLPYRITIGQSLSKKEKKAVQEVIETTFAEVIAKFDYEYPESEIAKANRAGKDQLIPLSPALQDLLSFCDEMVMLSCGRFDPTIEPLERAWKDPNSLTLQDACDATGWSHVTVHNGILKKDHADTRLDLGGVIKGICLDWMTERLQELSLKNFVVEWEGDFRAVGHHPENRDWLVQISPALTMDQKPIAPIPLRNAALATSKRPQKIIDPLTAAPVEKTPFSVACALVIAPTGAIADALATATLLFPTRKEAEKWAQEVVEKYPEVRFWILSYQ